MIVKPFLRVGDKVSLQDGTMVEVIEIPSSFLFVGKQTDGKKGIFYTSQLMRQEIEHEYQR